MLKLETTSGIVWVNRNHIVWFWDHADACHVALTGRDDMLTLTTLNAEQFAGIVDGYGFDEAPF
jgi:hypothetical protein